MVFLVDLLNFRIFNFVFWGILFVNNLVMNFCFRGVYGELFNLFRSIVVFCCLMCVLVNIVVCNLFIVLVGLMWISIFWVVVCNLGILFLIVIFVNVLSLFVFSELRVSKVLVWVIVDVVLFVMIFCRKGMILLILNLVVSLVDLVVILLLFVRSMVRFFLSLFFMMVVLCVFRGC